MPKGRDYGERARRGRPVERRSQAPEIVVLMDTLRQRLATDAILQDRTQKAGCGENEGMCEHGTGPGIIHSNAGVAVEVARYAGLQQCGADTLSTLVVEIRTGKDGKTVAGSEAHLEAPGLAPVIIRPIGEVAIPIDRLNREARGDRVAERCIQRRIDLLQPVVANIDLRVTAEFIRGLAGDDVDRTAGGIAAVESALRTLEDLEALQVVEHAAGG